MQFRHAVSVILGTGLSVMTGFAAAAEQVNIYSYRQPFLIQPMLDQFTEKTGIETNVVFAESGVAERLKREGKLSPADLVLTVDISRLEELVDADVTQPVNSDVLNENIPAQFRAADGSWFGLTVRTRNIYASRERVDQTELSYEDLSKPEWKGRICTRSGKHPYNIALIASMIERHGKDYTEEWLRGLKANLARRPQGGDRAQIKAVAEGECDLALGNSYYYGMMLADPEEKEFAEQVNVIFPNQTGEFNRGTHVNISGVVMTKAAPNKANALKLMEFLSGDEAQQLYANDNIEFPVAADIQVDGLLKEWTGFKADPLPLDTIASHRNEAVKLIDTVDFDG